MKQRRKKRKPARRSTLRSNGAPPDIFANLLEQAVESSSDFIAMSDLEGRFTFVNRAILEVGGYSKEELLGKHFDCVLSGHNSPELLREIGENIYSNNGWKGECVFGLRNGTGLPMVLSAGPVKDEEGRLVGAFGIARDITERKRADGALRQSEEQFRQLAENIREVFFIRAPDPDRVVYISPAYDEIWGRPREEVYARPTAWIDAVHPEDRDHATQNSLQSLRTGPTNFDYRVVRPDGSIRWINSRSFPVRDSTGKIRRSVGIAEDITKRKEEEDNLRDAHEKMNLALQETEQMARDAVRLTELVDILQSCQTVDEAYKIAGEALPTIIDAPSGVLCITSPSRNVVKTVAIWGKTLAAEKTFAPDSCWALRRGKAHLVREPESPMRCAHVSGTLTGGHLCIPLAAQGETLGVLYLENVGRSLDRSAGFLEWKWQALTRQAEDVGERLSLALANLRLREVLRSQSIRDPLTGLFNRRYMEESLERELSRADRNKQPVTLVMLDIDHFKQFNDLFGHQAGDALLRALR